MSSLVDTCACPYFDCFGVRYCRTLLSLFVNAHDAHMIGPALLAEDRHHYVDSKKRRNDLLCDGNDQAIFQAFKSRFESEEGSILYCLHGRLCVSETEKKLGLRNDVHV